MGEAEETRMEQSHVQDGGGKDGKDCETPKCVSRDGSKNPHLCCAYHALGFLGVRSGLCCICHNWSNTSIS